MNEGKTTQLINEQNFGGELLKTFSSTVDATTTFPVAEYPTYPVSGEEEDWDFDGWSKTNGGALDFPIADKTTPLAITTWGSSDNVNKLYAHYADVSDPVKGRVTWMGQKRKQLNFQNDLFTCGTTNSLYGLFSNKLSYQTFVNTQKIIMRNYTGWSTDTEPVAEGKTQEEEPGYLYAGHFLNYDFYSGDIYYGQGVTHLEVDIPNFKGRKHYIQYPYRIPQSAGIFVNMVYTSGTVARNDPLITNYAGQVLDCLSWKDGQFGDWWNLHVDPACAKLIAYQPELWGCIKGGPQEIWYPLLQRDCKDRIPDHHLCRSYFPNTCYLWDAGYLNRISVNYLISKTETKLRTLILHYAPDCPGYSEDWPICKYEIPSASADYDIHPEAKVYVPSAMIPLYEADENWARVIATGVEFLAIENCAARPDLGRDEDDWIRTELEAMLWRFEEYNKIDTIKEKRLWLKSCAGKGNDYNIPDKYKFDYPDWYWDIDTVDEGEVTYGACNTNSRTKNVTSPYLNDIMMNTFDSTKLNEFLTTIDSIGKQGLCFGLSGAPTSWSCLKNITTVNIPSNILYNYSNTSDGNIYLPNVKNLYFNCDNLNNPKYLFTRIAEGVNVYYNTKTSFENNRPYVLIYKCDANNVYINNELITDYTVTSSLDGLFYNNNNITSIEIASDVTSIATNMCYNCTNLASVIFGNNVTSIGSYAFDGCSSLTSVTIPDSVISIGEYAFYNCTSLTSAIIGNNVTSIDKYAFSSCKQLTNIIIPDSVTSLGSYAFAECNNLASITLSKNITTLNSNTFYLCTSLDNLVLDSVTSVASRCFYCCNGISNIEFKKSVSLSSDVFESALKSTCTIKFDETPSSLGMIFGNMLSSAISMYFPSLEEYYNIPMVHLSSRDDCDNVKKITYYFNNEPLTDISFPDDMTTTPDGAFSNAKINSISNWNNITQLGKDFLRASYIAEDIVIPANVIGCTESSNFVGTAGVKQISFEEGKTICYAGTSSYPKFKIYDDYTYRRTKTLVLPSTITEIQDYFIYVTNHSNLYWYVNIKVKATTPPTLAATGIECSYQLLSNGYFKILVPPSDDHSILNAYKAATNWSAFANYIEEYTEE